MSDLQVAVVDTDVFSHLYIRRGSADSRVPRWRDLLTGRRVLISFQTRAELLAGSIGNGWGERRTGHLRILDRTPTIRADNEVIEAHAKLVAECRRISHGLQDRTHSGDRWVAACAIAKGVELLAGDGIYVAAPGLVLLD